MSEYLNGPDSSDSENEKETKVLTETERTELIQSVLTLKTEGNQKFAAGEFEEAVKSYSQAIKALKENDLARDPILFLNRSASYISLKRFVPALSDATQGTYIAYIFSFHHSITNSFNTAIELDSDNWKGYWRKGVSLMALSKRMFRTKEAIETFEKCKTCSTLPANKVKEVDNELYKARSRMAQQEAESPPPDLSRCVPS